MFTQNGDSKTQSLQVSRMGNITGENFTLGGHTFLIKNNTEDNITAGVIPAGQVDPITTTLYPGWNPELVSEVITSVSGLQYGY